MSKETWELLRRIANERNISIEVLEEALEAALVSASKKMLDPDLEVTCAKIEPRTGEFRVYAQKQVVESVMNEATEISLAEARLYDVDARVEGFIEIDVTPHDFGRIAAQSAKQVITQRIREAEREMVYERYSNRIGELVSGTVQQYDRGNVIVDIGYAEAVLPYNEQAKGERFHFGDRVRAVILDVNQSNREAQVVLSRKTSELVKKLFEQEVSEVKDGTVVIKSVAREPGKRSKIAVMSTNLDVDPVGACVGMKGSRVQMVVQELKGERIDIIPFSQDKTRFVQNSLKPAEVESVEIDPTGQRATLVVKDDQLSLAIGKGGLNAKLASELTGVHIDIVSVSELEASERETRAMLASLPGAGSEIVERLMSAGVFSYEDILDYGVEWLIENAGLTQAQAEQMLEAARAFVAGELKPAYLEAAEEEAEEDVEEMEESEPVSEDESAEEETVEELEEPEEVAAAPDAPEDSSESVADLKE